jgi:uncharacterized protein with FMN-binding domain
MAGKMSPKFVALCSLAVGAIYSTGYSITASANTAATVPPQQSVASTPPSGATATASQPTGTSGTSTPATTTQQAASQQTQSKGSQKPSQNTTPSKTVHTSTSAQSKPKKAAPKVNTTQQFLDGTYNGSATNAIGSVSVAVSIKSGKITDVQITACDTHYPEAYINPVLPNYVVSHQTIRIPIVSGATMSTADFYYAVVQALQQAQNPHYKGA